MPKQAKREYVTFKSVRLPIRPYINNGKDCFRFSYPDESVKGGWRYGTRATKAEARQAAHAKAIEIASGFIDIANLSRHESELCRKFLELKPNQQDLDKLKEWKQREKTPISKAIADFHEFKLKEKGRSTNHLESQLTYLKRLEDFTSDAPIAEIKAPSINNWLNDLDLSDKSLNDHRSAAVALWIWCEKQEIIAPSGNFNEPQKTTVRKNEKQSAIETYTPEELSVLISSVEPSFLPWLVIVAFSGLRSGELHSHRKEPLKWSAIKLDQRVIDCPAHISKNRKRKLVPINDTLAAWLKHLKAPSNDSAICPSSPSKRETLRIGKLIGGWRKNALRHSYGSYRVAVTQDIASTAYEMDNSERIIKSHYLEAKTKAEGEAYFKLIPSEVYRIK
ncbi:hypothetical protein OAI07_01170 [Akkermansiaceae bacterium]|nr:hypothetical protein [Akkermansiaceae bacterium]